MSNKIVQDLEYGLRKIENPSFRMFVRAALGEYKLTGNLKDLKQCAQFKRFPVDIHTFLTSKEYMDAGAELYDEVLNQIIRMCTGGYQTLVLTGGIGSAKTTSALYIQAYQTYLISCLKCPQATYNLDKSSEIQIVFINKTVELAKKVSYDRLRAMIERSPYFQKYFMFDQNLKNKMVFPHRLELVPVGGGSHASIGQNVVGGILDEVNYMARVKDSKKIIGGDSGEYDQARAIYEAITRRIKSRFSTGHYAGILCIVSSRCYDGQLTDEIEEMAKRDSSIGVYDFRVWEVKPKGSFGQEYFAVFTGNELHQPKLLTDTELLNPPKYLLTKEGILRASEIIYVPQDFKNDFERDINNSLREIAGVNSRGSTPFILRTDLVREAMERDCGFQVNSDVINFGDKRLTIDMTKLAAPKDVPRAVHIDLSLTGDATGLAMSVVTGFRQVKRPDGDLVMLPNVVTELAVRVEKPTGGEIDYAAIEAMVFKLKARGINIKFITADTYQSTSTLQRFYKAGFIVGAVSTVTTPRVPMFFKELIYDGCWTIPNNQELFEEIKGLERDPETGKIDHSQVSKNDIFDAVSPSGYVVSSRREVWRYYGVDPKQGGTLIAGAMSHRMGHGAKQEINAA
ncbi:hypothetical protein ACRXCV_00190 (plasmid) [Halobacteriovorax sp. GFR7]|uniref:hypothetical protein n=1 Tax=unclassified Halobacteriovorax TaxID=2639665 RepID=UPI003D99A4C9